MPELLSYISRSGGGLREEPADLHRFLDCHTLATEHQKPTLCRATACSLATCQLVGIVKAHPHYAEHKRQSAEKVDGEEVVLFAVHGASWFGLPVV